MDLARPDLEKLSTLKPEDENIHLDDSDVNAMSSNLESAMKEDRRRFTGKGDPELEEFLRARVYSRKIDAKSPSVDDKKR